MMKITHRSGLVVAGIGLALMAGAASRAFAAPSGNLNLRTDGFELVTPNSGSPAHVDIDGIGQLIADTNGNFTGAETYTAVNPALPPGAASEEVCSGTIAGTITAPSGGFASGDGQFTISLNYTPSSGSTGTYCIPSTTAMLCNRSLFHTADVNDLDAGRYHCVATGVTASAGAAATVNGASLRGYIDSVRGANAPND